MSSPLRIALVEPVTPALLDARTVAALRGLLPPGAVLVHTGIAGGPASVETAEQEAAATPGTVKAVLEAAAGGADAAVIACVADVAVAEARSAVGIPVVGPGEAALGLAASWGGRVAIVIATDEGVGSMQRLVQRAGPGVDVASIRTLGVPIVDMPSRPEPTATALCREAGEAVVADGADTVVIGCTVAGPARRRLHEHLAARDLAARVIDPLSLGVQLAGTWATHLHRVASGHEEDGR